MAVMLIWMCSLGKGRAEEDLKELDQKNTITKDMVCGLNCRKLTTLCLVAAVP